MARVTVEDCIQVIPNRYELVLLSAQRARDIVAGAPVTIGRENDKNSVIALREVAEQTLDLNQIRRNIAGGVNRVDLNAEDESLMLSMAAGNPMPGVASDSVADAYEMDMPEIEDVSFEEPLEGEVDELSAETSEETEEELEVDEEDLDLDALIPSAADLADIEEEELDADEDEESKDA